MSARGWFLAITSTALVVFVLPFNLAAFGLAPNGTETVVLLVLLWAGSWVLGSRRTSKRTDP